jgi:hypothetical protein
MLLIYALDRIGKCKLKQNEIACGFVCPFRVMSKRIYLQEYGRSAFVSYL